MTTGARATVRVKLEIDSLSAMKARLVLRVEGHGEALESITSVALAQGEGEVEMALELVEPALWWPNGQGDQPLYRLEARLLDERSGELQDKRSTRFRRA